ncbi:MAG TPA: TonB-dependent receptor [Petrimonas sp.]|jgi:outer membrane receptor for ferrienterochelin and colicins|nr:TonB-dependent receptor [Petrimonas sp.]
MQEQFYSTRRLYVVGILFALFVNSPNVNGLLANPLPADTPFANAVSGSPDKLSSNSAYAEGDHTPVSRDKTDANVFGHVLDASTKEHLPYVTIQLKGTTVGTTTDATGHYFINNLPVGRFTILAKFVGYKTVEQEVLLEKNKTIELNFELESEPLSLNEVVVSANRNETSRKLAPSLVTILDMKTLEVTNSCDLSQGLRFQPGLRVENNCQNCGFTQVRINGLEGPYSQILINSRPTVGALAAVYGLEQIPANMIERVEVMRGGGSALFGSSAIGGVINIITREPIRNSGEVSYNTLNYDGTGSWQQSTAFNASILTDSRKAGITVFGQNRVRDAFDHDGDGFSELAELKNRTLGFHSFLKTGLYSMLTFDYRNMHEHRRGGDNLKLQPFEAYITEQLEHYINGGGLSFSRTDPDGNNALSLYASAQHVLRLSYYGGGDPVVSEATADELQDAFDNNNARLTSYGRSTELTFQAGSQYMYRFDRLLFMPAEITGGLEYLQDNLKDVSGYRREGINQITRNGSAFLQNEWKDEKWSFLLGGRLDKHNLVDGLIFSPRVNLRYNPTPNTNFRFSYSEGFRAPQYFDEDLHVDIAGGEQLVRHLAKGLKEERSRSVSGSVDYYHSFGAVQLNLMLEGFYTRLTDPFESVTKGRDVIVQNADDGVNVYGANLEGRVALGRNLQVQSGVTLQRSLYDNPRKWWEPASEEEKELDGVEALKRVMRTPNAYAYAVATWTPVKPLAVTLSGNYTGSMLVPHCAGEGVEGVDKFSKINVTEKSPSFFETNLRLAYTFKLNGEIELQLNGGVQNIFNAFQDDFDTGAGRDSAYTYGPTTPRSFFAGVKLGF